MGYYVFPSIIFFTLLTSEAHCARSVHPVIPKKLKKSAYLGVLSKYGQAERRTVRQMFEMECWAIKISLARNFVTALEHVQGNNIRGLGVP